jgi:hypothetical protein
MEQTYFFTSFIKSGDLLSTNKSAWFAATIFNFSKDYEEVNLPFHFLIMIVEAHSSACASESNRN